MVTKTLQHTCAYSTVFFNLR